MGIIKNRMKQVFMGNVQFQNMLTMKGTANTTQFFGRTAISSGTTFAVVSTSVVKSSDWIMATPMFVGTYTAQVAGLTLAVSSVQEGGSFRIHLANSGTWATAGLYACWEIRRIGS